MSNSYLTGTNFTGVLASTVTAVLTEIRDFAVDNGWSVYDGGPSSLPMVLKNNFNIDGIHPFYRFSNPASGTIAIQLDLLGDGTSLSSDLINRFTSITDGNKLWIASKDNKSLVVYSKPVSGDGKAIGFGWLDKIPNPNDHWAWALFNLDTVASATSSGNKRVARRYLTTTNFDWLNSSSSSNSFVTVNVFTNSATVFLSSPANNAAILSQIPAIDHENNFRGFYPLMINGLCGAPAGAVLSDETTGAKYIATGSGNHGFQIAGDE